MSTLPFGLTKEDYCNLRHLRENENIHNCNGGNEFLALHPKSPSNIRGIPLHSHSQLETWSWLVAGHFWQELDGKVNIYAGNKIEIYVL